MIHLTVTADADYIRLVAYEHALRAIMEQGKRPAWGRDDDFDPYEIAEDVLTTFADDMEGE